MRLLPRAFVLSCALAVVATIPVLAEDLTIVFKVTSKDGVSTSTQYMGSEHWKMSDPATDMMMEFGTRKMTMADHKKKEYWEATLDELNAQMQQAAAQMEEQMKKVEEQMKSLPQAVRDKMAGMAGGIVGSVTVTKGTGTRKIAGYDTEQYVMSMGENIRTEMWTTTALTIPAPAMDFRNTVMTLNPMFKNAASKLAGEMSKIKGYSLAETSTAKIMGKTIETSKEATAVTKGPIPASVFQIPAGYKKVETPFAKMGRK
jgi:hypothetical protein